MKTKRIAIIGAGPAGIYAASLLQKNGTTPIATQTDTNRVEQPQEYAIDLFEDLPAPYGLVRYGVAPDHPRIQGIVNTLRELIDSGNIRLFGGVRYGRELNLTDLKRHYNAVIFATGANRDRQLDIPGTEAAGFHGAADFVSWYDAHPEAPKNWPLTAQTIAVVGNGNVALDISRVLVKRAEDMQKTDIPEHVYKGLAANRVQDLHIFGRRGPQYVRFTPLELRELGETPGLTIVLDEADFQVADPYAERAFTGNKQAQVLARIMQKWRDEQTQVAADDHTANTQATEQDTANKQNRRIHLHFWSRPHSITVKNGKVTGIRVERTRPDPLGRVEGTGEYREYPTQAVYSAIGYYGSPEPEIPFDSETGVIPNTAGRVTQDGEPLPGVYATGWIKRGPVGLIGHTKADAMETVAALTKDAEETGPGKLWQPEETDPNAICELLNARNIPYTDLAGWHRLDAHEKKLGEKEGRDRVKVAGRQEMTEISRNQN